MSYRIVNRAGVLLASVGSDCPRRAMIMARLALARAYRDAGVTPHTFDCDPPFRIEW